MFSAMPKANDNNGGGCATTACAPLCAERSAARLVGEALAIMSDGDSSDDDSLHRQIAYLHASAGPILEACRMIE